MSSSQLFSRRRKEDGDDVSDCSRSKFNLNFTEKISDTLDHFQIILNNNDFENCLFQDFSVMHIEVALCETDSLLCFLAEIQICFKKVPLI